MPKHGAAHRAYDHERYFAPDIGAVQALVESGAFRSYVPLFGS